MKYLCVLGKEEDVYDFVKIEVDQSGFCAICKPSSTSSAVSAYNKKNDISERVKSDNYNVKDDSGEKIKIEGNSGNNESDSPAVVSNKMRDGIKSDDDEELELKYSSDSDNADGEEMWKIEAELGSDFNIIDEDDDDLKGSFLDLTDDKEKESLEDTSEKCGDSIGTKRKATLDSDDANDSDPEMGKRMDMRPRPGKRFIKELKSCKIRKGDFNLNNFHLALQVIILPKNEGDTISIEEAQLIKDSLLKELFLRAREARLGNTKVFPLKFSDCKIINPGWLLLQCEDKETFEWLLHWTIPHVESKSYKAIPALDKAPTQKIKFQVKTKISPDSDTMLKLIRLQNRNIDTGRWVLEEKKSLSNGLEQFLFQVDCGTVKILEKLEWTFFYELGAVKVIEHDGLPISSLKVTR